MKSLRFLKRSILTLLFLLIALTPNVLADNLDHRVIPADEISFRDNLSDQDYSRWSSPVYSHLIETEDGFTRVDYNYRTGKLNIEYYDKQFNLQSKKDLELLYQTFGGFYEGENYYFILSGQSNPDEDDEKPVMNIAKYNKDFELLGNVSLKGANTVYPFDAGSARFAEYGDILYIRTCHEMYKSANDGLNHQANVMLQVDTKNMFIIDSYYSVSNIYWGYVSHSFNQFIMIDDNKKIVCLDHGDANPRSAVLGTYLQTAGPESFKTSYTSVDLIKYEGRAGDNTTGATVGGLAYSKDNYLTVGSINDQKDYSKSIVKNVYVSVTPKSDISTGTQIKYLTEYSEPGPISASTPIMVKLDDDKFIVMWEHKDGKSSYGGGIGKVSYVLLDGKGDLIDGTEEKTIDAYLSDCVPVYNSDSETLTWYACGFDMNFYQLNLKDGSLNTTLLEQEKKVTSIKLSPTSVRMATKNPRKFEAQVSPENANNKELEWISSNPSVASVDQTGLVTGLDNGTVTITVKAKDGGGASAEATVEVYVLVEEIQINNKPTTLKAGETLNLSVSVLPANAKNKNLSFSSNNYSVADIDSTGRITARSAGTATITVFALDGSNVRTDFILTVTSAGDITGSGGLPGGAGGTLPPGPGTGGDSNTDNPGDPPNGSDNSNGGDSNNNGSTDNGSTNDGSNNNGSGNNGSNNGGSNNNGSGNNGSNNGSNTKPGTQKPSTTPVPVYRIYNRLTGEHLYTTDRNEVNVLTRGDWNDEGIGWNAPSEGTAVYRLYSPVTTVHLFTTDQNEVNVLSQQGWSIDNGGQPLFYSGGSTSVYRMYNPGLRMHLITIDKNEYDVLPGHGWNQEGVKLYAL